MGIRTGKKYLESLNDGRCVHIDGERVKDVSKDPRLCGAAETIAEIYDLQNQPHLTEKLTFEIDESGERSAMAFIEPKTVDDLVRRQEAYKIASDHTYGVLGRTPDFLNTVITTLATAHSVLEESASRKDLGKNVRAFYEYCRANDIAMTHVLVNPQVDRSKPVSEQEKDLAAKVVKETDSGFYVSGARMVGTLAPLSNEILNLPSPSRVHDKKSEAYVMGFAIPVNTPGITILSRPSLAPQKPGSFLDHPMSLRMDEGDAIVLFENAFVPWERTFLYRDVEMANTYLAKAQAIGHVTHQAMTRALSLAEFMCGLAIRVAKSTSVDGFPNVQNQLAELLMHVDIADAMLTTAVQRAKRTPFGTVVPEERFLTGLQADFYKRLDDMVDTLRTVGAGGLVGVPSYAELTGDSGDLVSKYFETADSSSEQRIRLMRLANDMCVSGLSGRMQLYERYYQGDPYRRRSIFYNTHPRKAQLVQRIDSAMADLARRSVAFDAMRFGKPGATR